MFVGGAQGAFSFPHGAWEKIEKEWNKQYPTEDHAWRFDQPGVKAEKKFRKAFADGYHSVTGYDYRPVKAVTTREGAEKELEAAEVRFTDLVRREAEKERNRRLENQ